MKRLLVMRHAKSDWDAGYARDHDRPLSKRGKRAAATMGRLLADIQEVPELVVSSSATRAHTTADLAAHAGSWMCPIEVSGDLYGTSPGEALRIIHRTPDQVDRLMVVGHEPTWSGLVHRLTGGAVQMKTATVVIIDLLVGRSWDSGDMVQGEIVAVLQPRHFEYVRTDEAGA